MLKDVSDTEIRNEKISLLRTGNRTLESNFLHQIEKMQLYTHIQVYKSNHGEFEIGIGFSSNNRIKPIKI